jgi:RNA polymerase sigma-70 factor (ECF subfamily)
MAASSESHEVSLLLRRWREGDSDSLNRLVPLVEVELREIAHRQMRREQAGHVLQTTALINEVYLRMLGQDQTDFNGRVHFLGIAARLMRQILVDYARRSRTAKRAAGEQALPLDEALVFSPSRSSEMLALDEALDRLNRIDARKVKVVELRYFGGLSVDETAQALDVSANTVIRDWALAKAWLRVEIDKTEGHGL